MRSYGFRVEALADCKGEVYAVFPNKALHPVLKAEPSNWILQLAGATQRGYLGPQTVTAWRTKLSEGAADMVRS